MDWTTIIDGLYVSALGMGMVMAVLLLLAVTVWLVSRLDRAVEARRRKQELADQPALSGNEVEARAGDDDLANVALVAVAVALAEAAEGDAMGSGTSPETAAESVATNDWLTQGRARQRSRSPGVAAELWKR